MEYVFHISLNCSHQHINQYPPTLTSPKVVVGASSSRPTSTLKSNHVIVVINDSNISLDNDEVDDIAVVIL